MERPPRILRILAIAILLATAIHATAHAGVLNMRWDRCWGDGGVMNKNFACDTNVGQQVLVGSFISPVAVPNVISNEIVIDIAVAGATLPPWWSVHNAATCRLNVLSTAAVPPPGSVACTDWGAGTAIGAFATYTADWFGPSTARATMLTAVLTTNAANIAAGQEYFSFVFRIGNARTVGSPSCAGCTAGACLALKSINLVTLNNLNNTMLTASTDSAGSDDRLVTWQGGAGVITQPIPGHLNCPRATPTRISTWGAVKSLYR